jgi:type II secretory pathway pseudopilin PulG
MIIALTIVAILAAMALVVGHHVTDNSKTQLTRTLIRTLDDSQARILADGKKVPSAFTDDAGDQYPIVDGNLQTPPPGDASGNPAGNPPTPPLPQPTQAYYTLATDQSESLASAAGGVGRYMVQAWVLGSQATTAAKSAAKDYVLDVSGTVAPKKSGAMNAAYTAVAGGSGISTGTQQLYRVPMFKDPWGNYIRFVHPKFQGVFGESSSTGNSSAITIKGTFAGGVQSLDLVRRNASPLGNSDGGVCAGSKGYFYSAGPDGKAETRDDNIYIGDTPPMPQ